MVRWAQELGYNIHMNQWEKLWKVDMKFTACYNLRENIMKMMYR